MKLLRAAEVPETPRDRVYRASRLHGALFVLVCLAACAAVLFYHWPARRPSYYIGAAILILLYLGRRFIIARFHPSNWLVRMGDDGLYLHFRSYLNEHLSEEDPTVAFLSYQEIQSARLVKEHVETPDPARNNTTQNQTIRWVEFELATDPAPLAAALDTESGRPAAPEKRWYGTSATLYRDYPVLMQSPPFLRVKWQVVPRASAFLEALRGHVAIAPEVVLAADLAHLQGLSRDQQETRLRELDKRGHTIAAVYMARKLYGGSLADATNFVNGLRGGSQS
jgi:hypothetical protein